MPDPQPDPGTARFPITTALEFPEWTVERSLGMVFGLVVRSMGAVRGIGAGFKAIAGGEVTQFTKLLEDSRRHALDRMIENARLVGANAVIQFRFDSSEMGQGQALTEIVAYGTAVVVGPRR
ncbi:MAG TPA: heavy metal-binding domain-containing protein [Acidimicrobiales bacterium]|nr:heavy metal-binding domain-containing protein [Acidimicrobiales bacterium]